MKKIFIGLLALCFVLISMNTVKAIEVVRQKNVATYVFFPIVDADGDIVSSAAGLDSETDTFADGTAPNGFADLTNEATEIGTSGWYYLSLTAGEVNFDYIAIQVKTTTSGAKTQHILIRTIVGDPLNLATSDDGGTINVTGGAVDTVTTTTTATTATNVTTVNGLAANVITAASIAADAIGASEIAASAITSSEAPNLDAAITTRSSHAAADVWAVGTRALTDKAGFSLSAAGIDAIWDEVITGHATADSFGKVFDDQIDGLRAYGDSGWATATGFSTHTAADIWSVGTRALTDKAGFTISGTKTTLDALNDISTAQVNTEVDTALADIDLDHLTKTALPTGISTDVALGSVIGNLLDNGTAWSFDRANDSLEALRDRGDSAWVTATGFSTHSAADVWTVGTRALTDKAGFSLSAAGIDSIWDEVITGHATADTFGKVFDDQVDGLRTYGDSNWATATGFSTHAAADVWTVGTRALTDKTGFSLSASGIDAIWDEAQSGHTTAGTFGKYLDTEVSGITATISDADIDKIWDELLSGHTTAGSTGKKLSDLPLSGTGDWTSNEKTEIKAVLGVTDTGTPDDTPGSGALYVMQGGTFSSSTDSLEAIRDRGDSAWITATGFSTHTAADIWTVTTRKLTELDEDNTTIDLDGSNVGGLTTWDKSGYSLSASGIDAIWDEVQSGHTTAGTFGKYLDSEVSGVALSDADVDKVWDELLSGHTTSGSTGKYLNDIQDATDGDKESGNYTGIEWMIRMR